MGALRATVGACEKKIFLPPPNNLFAHNQNNADNIRAYESYLENSGSAMGAYENRANRVTG